MGRISLPLPRDWPRFVRVALVHAIALARVVLSHGRASFDARQKTEIAMLREELRIKDSRLARIPPAKRPHYEPVERLAILALRAARGWNTAETARRFHVTAATIASWTDRLTEDGPDALVRTALPVNRYPDFVAELVARLRRALPALGKVRIAQLLARVGLHLAPTTVRRLAERRVPEPTPPSGADAAAARACSIVARRPHHVWHIDLTMLPTLGGWWVPWWPLALPQIWPLCFWLGVVLDRYSRAVVGWRLFYKQPSARQVCELLAQARRDAGVAPRCIVSDQAPQFRERYLRWCRRHGCRPRFGKVGEHGSIALIERFFRSLKNEMLRRLTIVPMGMAAMQLEVAAYVLWYHEHRPHQGLRGKTPAEVRDRLYPARNRRRLEPRTSWPLARGDPARRCRRVRGTLELEVTYLDEREHLPVIRLRDVA